ncbi:hypothetical protein Mkiyose1665_05350 [Mycobacterium kiyosense]|uniref:Uncharacterized protein n=1 Tax=Mycobacterium kiyosense TaxID=2871094 RepID=A0A9P3PZV3_9MYCO|nr:MULTISPECIES: hypothetical protein [Mycobacterium]BDE14084.1 hypothetical protein MKCMC460_29440 [Mycobacterium sp. 20KCMC460]GLB88190.1 hypothetical protein SRL2020130_10070 [Mycobacterium kiyosense]GLB94496.1 hypothetical protein SRL2020226_12720 [Mycobacterium kiyosense]GLB99966.1 hypothetical protein SRL2020400_05580 [Mycobacterium kiyosense]GLC05614.1 hypothetical protein SRL2020411_02600 [Mycobacterium kiyosense]
MTGEGVPAVVGDASGRAFPVDPDGLRAGGAQLLTDLLRSAETLPADNWVVDLTGFEEVAAGSTGRKVALTVRYAKLDDALHTELFVKFSRDLDNPVRDNARTQMEPEVRFAELSRAPGFPIAVPRALFADYHRRTGAGILITERIMFGSNGIERHYPKCLDYRMPRPEEHYRALLTALGRLAGAHRAGLLPQHSTEHFPLDVRAATVGERRVLTAEQLDRKLCRLTEFIGTWPGLLPVADPDFLDRLRRDVPRVALHEDLILRQLARDTDYVALCHWNANVDNAWFWRESDGVLRCGLLDWGCVSQMNLGMAIWGAMSGAETDLWSDHLDALLELFTDQVRHSGGPALDPDRLRRHTLRYAAVMGVAWLLDVPALLGKRFGTDVPPDRFDPRISEHEDVRAPLQMLVNLLNLWQRHRIGDLLDEAIAEVR